MNNLGKKRVLVVEDSVDDVELIVEALAGYRETADIDVATDGEEALDYLHRRGRFSSRAADDPCLVLLDIKMPKVDGIEVLRRLKADPRTWAIPVVVMTSSREERDVVETYKLGANSYIVKPLDFVKFTEAVRQVGLYWLLLNQPGAG